MALSFFQLTVYLFDYNNIRYATINILVIVGLMSAVTVSKYMTCLTMGKSWVVNIELGKVSLCEIKTRMRIYMVELRKINQKWRKGESEKGYWAERSTDPLYVQLCFRTGKSNSWLFLVNKESYNENGDVESTLFILSIDARNENDINLKKWKTTS